MADSYSNVHYTSEDVPTVQMLKLVGEAAVAVIFGSYTKSGDTTLYMTPEQARVLVDAFLEAALTAQHDGYLPPAGEE